MVICKSWVLIMKIFKYICAVVVLLTIGMLITAIAMSFPADAAPLAPPASAQLPAGASLVGGQATVIQSGPVMSINQSTSQAALNWTTFNIGSAATVNINQPSSSSVLLNQVQSQSPSLIYGHLNANGQVFLTNSSGIYFAPSASANVGGLVATTNTISASDFMRGLTKFSGDGFASQVVNDGALTASLGGYIALLAPTVRNNGVIVAQMGTVALAAGSQYTLEFRGNSLSAVTVTPAAIDALVTNGNAVYAPGGLIILSAQGARQIQSGVIGNTGVLNATGAVNDGGVVRLTASQTINAGGAIKADAALNTSSNAGTVSFIADLTNPSSQTNVMGFVSAQGGNLGGNGGAVETSGSTVKVSQAASINTLASKGKTGTWTLDPTDFIIDSIANAGDMNASTLDLNLTTSNVVISSANGNGGTHGNIQVNQGINWLAATTLTLNAVNNIVLSQPITENAVSSNLILNAGGDINVNAQVASYAVKTGITLNAGNNANINSPITINGVSSELTILAKQNITTTALISSVAAASSQITLNAQNNVIIGGGVNIAGVSAHLNVNSGSDTQINSPISGLGATTSINVNAGRDLITSGASVLNTTGAGTNIYLLAGRNLTVGSAVSTVGATSPVELYSGLAGTSPGLTSGTVVLNGPVSGTSVSILFNPDGYSNTAANIALYPVGSNSRALIYLVGNNKVYDATTTAGPLSIVGNPTLGGNVTLFNGTASFASASAGTGVPIVFNGYSLGGPDGSRFSLVPNSNTTLANITPKPLTVTAVGVNKTYDGTTLATALVTATPQIGDVVSFLAGPSAFNTVNVGVSIPVQVTGITESGPNAGNYSINSTAITTANILQAALSVTASNMYKSYGQSAVPTQFTSSGLMGGETIGSVVLTSAGSAVNAGVPLSPYAITPSNASGGTFAASNYNITYTNGMLYVTPTPLLISIPDEWKLFGTTMTPTAFSVKGLVPGDTIGALTETSLGTASNAALGDYPIQVGPLTGGSLSLSNYTVTEINGTLHVVSNLQ